MPGLVSSADAARLRTALAARLPGELTLVDIPVDISITIIAGQHRLRAWRQLPQMLQSQPEPVQLDNTYPIELFEDSEFFCVLTGVFSS